MRKKTFISIAIVVVITTMLSAWIGWYATALGLGILGIWFGVVLWRTAKLDARVLLLLAVEVILIWLAFSLAYLEMSSNLSNALSISMQNLLHFNFINIPDELSNLWLYRLMAALEGFTGYLLIVSGVALLITDRVKNS